MARILPHDINTRPSGTLSFEEEHPGFNGVYFAPSKESLALAGLDTRNPEKFKKLILHVDCTNSFISIYPINTLPTNDGFLKQKYNALEAITLEGFDYGYAENEDEVMEILEALPSAFVKDYNYGLGFRKDYRFIFNILEELNVQHLVISKKDNTAIHKECAVCTVKYSDFEQIRKAIDRITRESRAVSNEVKKISAHNFLAFFLNDETKYPQKDIRKQSSTLARLIAKSSPVLPVHLSTNEQREAIDLVRSNKEKMAKDQPAALVKLRNDIELVTLKQLIKTYEEMLGKKLKEDRWTALFNENPFILTLAFGYPIIKIQDQAHLGGRKFSGAGEKITDYLVKHGLSNNAALFEIKTPSAKILNSKPYRDGVYAPSKMNVTELYRLTIWVNKELVQPKLPQKYSQLHSVLQQNAQPNQPKAAFETQQNELINAIKGIDLSWLTRDQVSFLDENASTSSTGSCQPTAKTKTSLNGFMRCGWIRFALLRIAALCLLASISTGYCKGNQRLFIAQATIWMMMHCLPNWVFWMQVKTILQNSRM